jgi:hypothetical protein
VKSSVTTSITQSEFVTELQKKTVDSRLQVLIYCISYAKTFRDGKFYGYNNNYANITLTTNYGTNVEYFINREYSCVNISNSTGEPTSQPIANFNNIGKFFDFMIARLSPNVSRVFGETTGIGITKYYYVSNSETKKKFIISGFELPFSFAKVIGEESTGGDVYIVKVSSPLAWLFSNVFRVEKLDANKLIVEAIDAL